MPPIPKQRPKALDKKDAKRIEEEVYRKNRVKAIQRDGKCCRICGSIYRLETHHVERRSKFGQKKVLSKHDLSNLLTVCADCHRLFTENVLKAVSTSAVGTNGPVLVEKWDDVAKDYVAWKKAA